MAAPAEAKPLEVVQRLLEAMNRQDLKGLLACFHPDYRSEQPAHSNRAGEDVDETVQRLAGQDRGT